MRLFAHFPKSIPHSPNRHNSMDTTHNNSTHNNSVFNNWTQHNSTTQLSMFHNHECQPHLTHSYSFRLITYPSWPNHALASRIHYRPCQSNGHICHQCALIQQQSSVKYFNYLHLLLIWLCHNLVVIATNLPNCATDSLTCTSTSPWCTILQSIYPTSYPFFSLHSA